MVVAVFSRRFLENPSIAEQRGQNHPSEHLAPALFLPCSWTPSLQNCERINFVTEVTLSVYFVMHPPPSPYLRLPACPGRSWLEPVSLAVTGQSCFVSWSFDLYYTEFTKDFDLTTLAFSRPAGYGPADSNFESNSG